MVLIFLFPYTLPLPWWFQRALSLFVSQFFRLRPSRLSPLRLSSPPGLPRAVILFFLALRLPLFRFFMDGRPLFRCGRWARLLFRGRVGLVGAIGLWGLFRLRPFGVFAEGQLMIAVDLECIFMALWRCCRPLFIQFLALTLSLALICRLWGYRRHRQHPWSRCGSCRWLLHRFRRPSPFLFSLFPSLTAVPWWALLDGIRLFCFVMSCRCRRSPLLPFGARIERYRRFGPKSRPIPRPSTPCLKVPAIWRPTMPSISDIFHWFSSHARPRHW